jgi:hypothetical protein
MHRHSRSARLRACSAGGVTGRPRYSARRAKVGFGDEFGGSRAVRADGSVVWVWKRRIKQLARTEHDLAAHATALGTADAAKGVIRQEHCRTQPRATISMSRTTGPCRRPTAEPAERRLGFRWSSISRTRRRRRGHCWARTRNSPREPYTHLAPACSTCHRYLNEGLIS